MRRTKRKAAAAARELDSHTDDFAGRRRQHADDDACLIG